MFHVLSVNTFLRCIKLGGYRSGDMLMAVIVSMFGASVLGNGLISSYT